MTINLNLTLLFRACLQFFMAVEAYTPHIIRTQQQLPARRIGWMIYMFMGDRGRSILDRKRHGFFGWVITCSSSVSNFTIGTIFIDNTLDHIISGCFPVDADCPFGVHCLVTWLAGCRSLEFGNFGSNLRHRSTAVMPVLIKRGGGWWIFFFFLQKKKKYT